MESCLARLTGIMRMRPATGGTPELIVKAGVGEVLDTPQMLPDSRTVLFTVTTSVGADRWEKANVVAQALGSSERTLLLRAEAPAAMCHPATSFTRWAEPCSAWRST